MPSICSIHGVIGHFGFFKTSMWNEYVLSWMSHSTYVNPLFSQTKWYVLISFKYSIPPTCLKHTHELIPCRYMISIVNRSKCLSNVFWRSLYLVQDTFLLHFIVQGCLKNDNLSKSSWNHETIFFPVDFFLCHFCCNVIWFDLQILMIELRQEK